MEASQGVVVEFPKTMSCYDCVHHLEGPLGLACGYYMEKVNDDSIAVECSEFEVF